LLQISEWSKDTQAVLCQRLQLCHPWAQMPAQYRIPAHSWACHSHSCIFRRQQGERQALCRAMPPILTSGSRFGRFRLIDFIWQHVIVWPRAK
jgi:hypothetical protein